MAKRSRVLEEIIGRQMHHALIAISRFGKYIRVRKTKMLVRGERIVISTSYAAFDRDTRKGDPLYEIRITRDGTVISIQRYWTRKQALSIHRMAVDGFRDKRRSSASSYKYKNRKV